MRSVRRAMKDGGSIVNIGSVLGSTRRPPQAAYARRSGDHRLTRASRSGTAARASA